MLPDGFKLAPQERWTEEIKEETEGVYFTNYSEDKDNIIIVGPLPGDTNKECNQSNYSIRALKYNLSI